MYKLPGLASEGKPVHSPRGRLRYSVCTMKATLLSLANYARNVDYVVQQKIKCLARNMKGP